MASTGGVGLLVGAVALGAVHGVEPGHGWPVAATYALDRANKWVYGVAAGLLVGLGHLVSSIAMVGVFFYAKGRLDLAGVDEPLTVLGGVRIGGPVSLVAGVLLVALGVREYRHGHSHRPDHRNHPDRTHDHSAHSDDHDEQSHDHDEQSHDHDEQSHDHDEQSHDHDDGHADGRDGGGLLARLKAAVPFAGGHAHAHGEFDGAADRGLLGIAWFAFVLGFAHEEEFEIIALCAGSTRCLELMAAYAATVVVAIVGLTLLLVAGYEWFEDSVRRYTPYLPAFSAAVLVGMGLGFVLGVF